MLIVKRMCNYVIKFNDLNLMIGNKFFLYFLFVCIVLGLIGRLEINLVL